MAFHRWCRAHRTWPGGLYWATGLSSGMDNQTRVPDSMHHHCHWTWVDANMQAALDCLSLGQMATVLGENELAEELNQERSFLLREINARLWSAESSFYHDVDPAGRHSRVKSVGAYWALLDKEMVPRERLEPFLRHLREPSAFKRHHRIPSQSADSEGYDAESGGYWRGGVWSPTNYMVLIGLRLNGQLALAHEIALNHLNNVCLVFQHTDTFWENYAPETVAPGQPAKADFVGWTGLAPIAMLLEYVIGVNVDWPLRRVTWNRCLSGDMPYGVENYPLGSDGLMNLAGDQLNVTVQTNLPFTLVIQDGEGSHQTAVDAGTTEIDLT
jgi:glycogen debranching enzyme